VTPVRPRWAESAEAYLRGRFTIDETAEMIRQDYRITDEFDLEDLPLLVRFLADKLTPPYRPWA